jgi:tRNA dimethylallyltransferase
MVIKVAAIVGPTAAGKSEVAVDVAMALGAEVVSIDSMQSYQDLDIGSAKPSAEMRRRVPHHLLDRWPSSHELTVAEFQLAARGAIEDIAKRGLLPLIVGGSGLYFRAVVDDLELPPRSDEVRARLENEAEVLGPEALYARLQQRDPVAASRIAPTNVRRIVRALEVITVTGVPFSANHVWDRYESRYELAVAGLTRARPELFERIEERARAMVASGLLEETALLVDRGLSATASQALGYRQVIERFGASEQDVVAAIVKATKRFARRQESWFRADPRVRWFNARTDPSQVDAIVEFFRASLRLP